MAATSTPLNTAPRYDTEPVNAASATGLTVPTPQPLWRFVLIGLGPLTALGVFALVVALFQRLST